MPLQQITPKNSLIDVVNEFAVILDVGLIVSSFYLFNFDAALELILSALEFTMLAFEGSVIALKCIVHAIVVLDDSTIVLDGFIVILEGSIVALECITHAFNFLSFFFWKTVKLLSMVF